MGLIRTFVSQSVGGWIWSVWKSLGRLESPAPERLNQSQQFDKWMDIRTSVNQLLEALKVDQANAVVVRLQTVVVNKLYWTGCQEEWLKCVLPEQTYWLTVQLEGLSVSPLRKTFLSRIELVPRTNCTTTSALVLARVRGPDKGEGMGMSKCAWGQPDGDTPDRALLVHTLLIEWPDHNDLVSRLKACVEDQFEVKILGHWRANQRMQFQAVAAAREGCARDDITNVAQYKTCVYLKSCSYWIDSP